MPPRARTRTPHPNVARHAPRPARHTMHDAPCPPTQAAVCRAAQMLKMKVSHKVISFVMLLIIGVEIFSPTSTDVSAEVSLGQLYSASPFQNLKLSHTLRPPTPLNTLVPSLTRSGSASFTMRRPAQVGRCAAAPPLPFRSPPLPFRSPPLPLCCPSAVSPLPLCAHSASAPTLLPLMTFAARPQAINKEPYRSMVIRMGEFFNNPFHESQNCGTESPIDNECNSPSTNLVRDNIVYLQIYDQVYFEIPDPNGADVYPDCTLANFYSFARVEIEKLHDICPNHISRLREKWLFPVSLFEHFEQQRCASRSSTGSGAAAPCIQGCIQGCNPACPRLQPCALLIEAAALCTKGHSPTHLLAGSSSALPLTPSTTHCSTPRYGSRRRPTIRASPSTVRAPLPPGRQPSVATGCNPLCMSRLQPYTVEAAALCAQAVAPCGYTGVLSTLYITLLLGVMAFLFSRDMDNLVIRPIETMVDSVTRLAPQHAQSAVAV